MTRMNCAPSTVDRFLKFEDVKPLQNYERCIIKEELIISESDDDDEEVDVVTVDKSCSELLANFKIFETKKKPTSHKNDKKDKVLIVRLSLKKECPVISEGKNKQTTEKKPESLEKKTSNGYANGLVTVVEPDIETAMKKLTKSHCTSCKRKAKVVVRKARCAKCARPLSYDCENCEKTFKSYNSLIYHLKAKHVAVTSTHKCAKCKRAFVQRRNMLAHRKICGRERAYGCAECPHRAYYKSNLIKHIQEKHSGRVFDCKSCEKLFSNQRSLNRHVRCYCGRKQSLQCHHCAHKVYRKDHMIGHLKRVHWEVYGGDIARNAYLLRNCEYCGVTLKKYEAIRYHLERCDAAPLSFRRGFKSANQPDVDAAMKNLCKAYCIKCNKKRAVIRRVARCSKCKNQLIYNCESCCKSYPNSTTLREHLKAKHLRYITYHQCDQCNCSYTHRKHLITHQKVRHSGEVQVLDARQCLRCGREFSNLTNMTRHRLVCGRERTICCDMCSHKTHYKASLLGHFKGKHPECLL